MKLADAEKTDAKRRKRNTESEVQKYNIQLTFEDGTTSEIHTFPFGDTEEAELHLEGSVAYLVFDSTSQKKSINTLDTEKSTGTDTNSSAGSTGNYRKLRQ